MIEVHQNLYVGGDSDCAVFTSSNKAVVHACKSCHRKQLGYTGSLPNNDPHYLIAKKPQNIYLNLVDMPQELKPEFTDPILKSAIEFIDTHWPQKPVLIHCNQGASRAPSVALVYLAKKSLIANSSYNSAVSAFAPKYPDFSTGAGIELYLRNNWAKIMDANF